MFDPSILATFSVASLLLCLAPGPDNLFVFMQSILQGRRAGLLITLGICSGLVGHSVAVALGLAVVVQQHPIALETIKLLGGIYLLYLAWGAFSASKSTIASVLPSAARSKQNIEHFAHFKKGVVLNLTNPKVGLFFLAFLPQFTAPEQGNVEWQIAVLGCIFMLIAGSVFGAIALMASTARSWIETHPHFEIILNRIAGCLFIGLATHLVWSN